MARKGKGIGKSSTTAPAPKKRKQGERSSRQAKGKQVVEGSQRVPLRPRPHLNLSTDEAIAWHRGFVPSGISRACEFEHGAGTIRQLECKHVRGIDVPLDRRSFYAFLGVENADPRRLTKFVKSPSYKAISHTLCGVDSNAKWTRKQGDIHLHMVRSAFNKTAKEWRNFVQARLIPVEHNINCTRARVCVIFFLMTGRPINVGEIMLGEIARTRFGRHIRRFFFDNLLTQYMLSREVLEYLGYDEVVEAPKGLLDITSLLEPTSKLTQAARNERDENFNRNVRDCAWQPRSLVGGCKHYQRLRHGGRGW
nr:uncharacterized protein LOC117276666 [Nicotiana tomentosiformis]